MALVVVTFATHLPLPEAEVAARAGGAVTVVASTTGRSGRASRCPPPWPAAVGPPPSGGCSHVVRGSGADK